MVLTSLVDRYSLPPLVTPNRLQKETTALPPNVARVKVTQIDQEIVNVPKIYQPQRSNSDGQLRGIMIFL